MTMDDEVYSGFVVKEEVVSSSSVCGEYKADYFSGKGRYDAESSLPTPFQHQIEDVPLRERSPCFSHTSGCLCLGPNAVLEFRCMLQGVWDCQASPNVKARGFSLPCSPHPLVHRHRAPILS